MVVLFSPTNSHWSLTNNNQTYLSLLRRWLISEQLKGRRGSEPTIWTGGSWLFWKCASREEQSSWKQRRTPSAHLSSSLIRKLLLLRWEGNKKKKKKFCCCDSDAEKMWLSAEMKTGSRRFSSSFSFSEGDSVSWKVLSLLFWLILRASKLFRFPKAHRSFSAPR